MAIGLAGVLALVAAGCGSSSSSSGGGSSSSTTQTSTGSSSSSSSSSGSKLAVTEQEYSIAPANPKIAKAGKMTLTVSNKGSVSHALVVEGPGLSEQKTPIIAPGQSATLTVDFAKKGTYEWYCPIDGHRAQGMDGKIAVAGGGGGGGGGTSTQSSNKSNGY
ncbi:MAG: hypothetical protein QOG70_3555 [Solirubrobacteraceae bacterium]|jgi:uncharacterized cupredoxin-like copper-binding protein|nr:hypothetical protein [Solirubrobacteraceae bacterium]